MKNTHLSESEIQQIILENGTITPEINAHLQQCDYCKTQADSYLLLFKKIEALPKPSFDFNLSELVIPNLSRSRPQFKVAILFGYGLSFIGLLFLGIAFTWFGANTISVSITLGLQKMVLYLLLTGTIVISLFQAMEIYKRHSKKMEILKFQ